MVFNGWAFWVACGCMKCFVNFSKVRLEALEGSRLRLIFAPNSLLVFTLLLLIDKLPFKSLGKISLFFA